MYWLTRKRQPAPSSGIGESASTLMRPDVVTSRPVTRPTRPRAMSVTPIAIDDRGRDHPQPSGRSLADHRQDQVRERRGHAAARRSGTNAARRANDSIRRGRAAPAPLSTTTGPHPPALHEDARDNPDQHARFENAGRLPIAHLAALRSSSLVVISVEAGLSSRLQTRVTVRSPCRSPRTPPFAARTGCPIGAAPCCRSSW